MLNASMDSLREVASSLLEWIAPFICIGCGKSAAEPERPLCPRCIGRLAWWRTLDGCPRCGSRPQAALRHGSSPHTADPFELERADVDLLTGACPGCYADGSALHRCHALLRYEGPVQNWIPMFKHRRTPLGPPLESRIAVEFLARELGRSRSVAGSPPPDLILPVPLHPRRRLRRGFNHSDVIARRIAHCLDRPFSIHALRRRWHTPPQTSLTIEERRANLRGAFRASRPMHGVECVWLVDDVLTTGATLDAAADACLEAGAGEVHGLALAATSPNFRSICADPAPS